MHAERQLPWLTLNRFSDCPHRRTWLLADSPVKRLRQLGELLGRPTSRYLSTRPQPLAGNRAADGLDRHVPNQLLEVVDKAVYLLIDSNLDGLHAATLPIKRALRNRPRERLPLAVEQLAELDEERRQRLKQPDGDPQALKTLELARLCGIGTVSAWILVAEVFGWRTFRNRKEVGACVGLVPTPFISEDGRREQGISKSGNKRPRRVLNELAWLWLRYQPDSALSKWFYDRWGAAGGRARKVGITALSRRLMIALWQYLENGVVPEGANQKLVVHVS